MCVSVRQHSGTWCSVLYVSAFGRWASLHSYLSCRVFVRSWSALARSAGRFARSCGFRSLGSRVSLWSCWQVLYLVLRVRARGPNSVHSSIRCTTHSQSDVPGVLVLERLRVVAGGKKRGGQRSRRHRHQRKDRIHEGLGQDDQVATGSSQVTDIAKVGKIKAVPYGNDSSTSKGEEQCLTWNQQSKVWR